MSFTRLLPVAALFAVNLCFAGAGPTKDVETVLNQLHAAAAKADGKTYFSLFAPEAVFLGTDATERWPLEEFRTYAMKRFATGTGWTYSVTTRHVDFSPSSDVAWFDELLDNKKYGTCRGTGVLRRVDGHWKISQYHLTIPIPNDLTPSVAKMIREATPK